MSVSSNQACVSALLGGLRAEVGDIEFGYRAQGLFAHVLKEIGASVLRVRNTGHPDVTAVLDGQLTRVEVEIASISKRYHVIKEDDVRAVVPTSEREQGYLTVLDIAEPVRWAPIEYSRIRHRLGRQRLATLHALAKPELARECNDVFAEIVITNADRLLALTFNRLCQEIKPS